MTTLEVGKIYQLYNKDIEDTSTSEEIIFITKKEIVRVGEHQITKVYYYYMDDPYRTYDGNEKALVVNYIVVELNNV